VYGSCLLLLRADKIDDPISGKKITVMIFANGSMNFLGGRSRQAIHDAYDTMTRKEEPVGFLREFGIGISDVPPTPRGGSGGGGGSGGMSPRTVAAPQSPLSKEEVVDQAIAAGEDAVDDGDGQEDSKTLSVGVKKNLRRELLKCFADGDSEGDAKPWRVIEAKLQAYVLEKKKSSLKHDEMAAALAGSLKRLLPRRDEAAAAAAAEQREAEATATAAAKAAEDAAKAAAAATAEADAAAAAAATGGLPASPGTGSVAFLANSGGGEGGGGTKRKADEAMASLPSESIEQGSAEMNTELQALGVGGAQASDHDTAAAAAAGDGAQAAGLSSGSSSDKPQPVRLGVGKSVKFGLGGMKKGVASKKQKKRKAFGFSDTADDDE
jgi:hypothetical protein